ncbi:chemotaxis protein CheB [Fischerella thermalis]|jgi:two-component system chemotaxis response regulator CheB|uniref:chemotaxis protein CheB n=1 Tax=Fischerella thermalis TaxID=372787 RepID=UPI000C7FD102|nr:chemotaxis protein CheB [Fischerella thermalis]PLZ09536.1 chemotaxis protein CheB [Fischerella thermalis WC119]PLZ23765.1 chemotaxis protein CheB [Fischerella thermalis WC341]PLZ33830.1 chemotaxis protein CheB [Fischerella thermalis WC558]PLZ34422.1 chemotaxis protein CheB [Fischerella thermalis WC559]PLZ39452.1 chemotaxis protein CheB [Fischerella thermalis WC542]
MKYQIIVIGTSLGGLEALQVILLGLPKTFPVPIAVVQHRHKDSDDTLRVLLQSYTNLVVKEAEDKEEILPGWVYLAPADYHLLIESKDKTVSQPYFSLSTDAPVTYARPSIDVLFETAADAYNQKVIGILLTGANQDGVQGLAKIKARGGMSIVEEPESAFCSIMPAAAIAFGVADQVLPLVDIASFLVKICN